MSEPAVRPAATATVAVLPALSADWRHAATEGTAGHDRHDRLLAESGVFDRVRLVQSRPPAAPSAPLRIAAWNLERCKHVSETAAALRGAGADIVLATEVDLGMARSGNRDTTADLAAALGMGHAFAVEFIELGLGDEREQAEHADETNAAGIHGNAVLSLFEFDRAAVLPLDPGGAWFTDDAGNDQRRIGGRMAIAVRHLLPEPVWFGAVHYESRLGPEDRAAETRVLIAHLDRLCGSEPVLIAGDFNCKAIQEAGMAGAAVLDRPGEAEPMFQLLAAAGFDWRTCNRSDDTTRLHPWHPPQTPTKRIDWFFSRGLSCSSPAVVPAIGENGINLSDHEMITVEVTP